MSGDDDPTGTNVTEAEREVLLSFYGFAREEIISESELLNKRITQGLAVVAAVIGYGLFRDSLWIVAFTPFIFATIFLHFLQAINGIAKDAQFMIGIEPRLKYITSHADFESSYGAFYGDSIGESGLILTLERLGDFAQFAISAVGYFFVMWMGYAFWNGRPAELSGVTHSDLVVSYILITVVVLIVGIVNLRYFVNLTPGEPE